MTNYSQVETQMRTASMQMSFPETVSDSLCRNSLVTQTDCCSSCLGGWSQMILEVKMLDVEVLGWCGYTWPAVVDVLTKSLKRLWRRLMVDKLTFNSWATALVDIHCTLPQNLRHVALCCDKTANFRVAFYCGQPKVHLCNNHAV